MIFKKNNIFKHVGLVAVLLTITVVGFVTLFPQGVFGQGTIEVTLDNPIKAPSLYCFLKDVLDIVLTIGIIIAALAIVYAGFLFVTARGSDAQLTSAKHALLGAVIGTAILLGSWGVVGAIIDTLTGVGVQGIGDVTKKVCV